MNAARRLVATVCAASLLAGSAAAAQKSDHHAKPLVRATHQVPAPAAPSLEPLPDLSHAIPARDIGKLPSTADQYRALRTEIGREKPAVDTARLKSERLNAQTEALRQRLIDSATRVQYLETEKIRLDADILRLAAEDKALTESFARDRVSVARLIAVLERLEHDMPPAMALRPDDALAAARGSMLIGSSLPSVYGEAAALAARIRKTEQTHAALIARRAEGVRNAQELVAARSSLNQLLAIKQNDAREAETAYGDLKAKLAAIASHAADLQALLSKVAALRGQPAPQSVVVVTAESSARFKPLTRGSLLKPVVGYVVVPSSSADSLGPGVTLETAPGAQVIAPADGKVLFAGPYHKSNHVLILETALGYDAVLAGLDRVDVRPDDEVLAGEPVGDMPKDDRAERLYFELRQNGHGIDPAPYLSLELRKAKRI